MTGGGAWRRDQIRHVQGVGGRGYEYMLCYGVYAAARVYLSFSTISASATVLRNCNWLATSSKTPRTFRFLRVSIVQARED